MTVKKLTDITRKQGLDIVPKLAGYVLWPIYSFTLANYADSRIFLTGGKTAMDEVVGTCKEFAYDARRKKWEEADGLPDLK